MPTRRQSVLNKAGIKVRHNFKHAANMESIRKNLRSQRHDVGSRIEVADAKKRGKPTHRVSKQLTG